MTCRWCKKELIVVRTKTQTYKFCPDYRKGKHHDFIVEEVSKKQA